MRSIAKEGSFDELSEFGVPGREFIVCCTEIWKKKIKQKPQIKFYFTQFNRPSCLLGVSGVDLLPGTMSRLKFETRSRKDSAGLGGATGRCGNVLKRKMNLYICIYHHIRDFQLRLKKVTQKSTVFQIGWLFVTLFPTNFQPVPNLFVAISASFQFSFAVVEAPEANNHPLEATAA